MYKNRPFKPLVFRREGYTDVENSEKKTEKTISNKSTRSKQEILNFLKSSEKRNFEEIIQEEPRTNTAVINEETNENQQPTAINNTPAALNDSAMIFNVVFGKKSTKKHKTWSDDGVLEVVGKIATLKDSTGVTVGKTWLKIKDLKGGDRISIGNKEVEIVNEISEHKNNEDIHDTKENVEPPRKKMKTFVSHKPILQESSRKGLNANYEPLVMPCMDTSSKWSEQVDIQKEVEVFVDPCLARILRPHQRQGVVFLYQCIMGLSVPNCYGAILADEMGLGKTLQCITLIWTLLNKGPYGKPVLKKVIIVTPSSLCNNWDKEFLRWLGSHRISPYVVNAKNKVSDFRKRPRPTVLIISYEMVIRNIQEINDIEFDLLLCDEGHRLKNSDVKASKLLSEMNCKRRILLSGTLIQNDLQEFYTLVNFVNPGILHSYNEYKNYYESYIVSSQISLYDNTNSLLGQERAQELHNRTKKFILRRTQETINKYLPSKHEIVIFCKLSAKQREIYSLLTNIWFSKEVDLGKHCPPLTLITALKKICNHPTLLASTKSDFPYDDVNFLNRVTELTKIVDNPQEYAGKLTIIKTIMRSLKRTNEKLVLISYYTQTLSLLEKACNTEGMQYLRLDGSTPHHLRMKIIEKFNDKQNEKKVFLLSAKAGGVGLNLPGASRLILFDSDWNPASDAQAMARIWRDGQRNDVYIYRLLTTGTIEEKIYQRQIAKTNLSEAVMDSKYLMSMKLSSDELKNLFSLCTDTASLTHESIKCSCGGLKTEQTSVEESQSEFQREYQFTLREKNVQQNLTISQLMDWQHYKQPVPNNVLSEILLLEMSQNITFVFKNSVLQKVQE